MAIRQNRARILQLYEYYQRTFLARPDQFLWAGLGRMAGGAVVGGIDLFVAVPELDPGFLTTTMVRIGKEIFLDLAWQHEAFLADPVNAIQLVREHDVRHTAKASYASAWEKITSGNTEAIAEGNRMLLENEQFSIVGHITTSCEEILIAPGSQGISGHLLEIFTPIIAIS